ncbi:hypothetical protein A5757_10380 [Mycobacterium sp. 852013-51886_SCH5428379]|uniref:hypothetical protein n=1 Tax=Mycobacterium sp. 852013-51886_SCH5428379 TaxID=1834111 RepID=UPI000800E21F|nr:hypothetical protein [Mycobacterium sp. 852013-51886_SCH5428379]OBB60072.1 hypothetical protein A5757_10380 [Mycobacterium sp. 852013-51886_SCH5428379]
MTVTVTLAGGDTVAYMRFGDTYVKRDDGSLDVKRTGATTLTYAAEEWSDVAGDQAKSGRRGFFRR